MTRRLLPGDLAPAFELSTAAGGRLDSEGLRGRRVVLYFYPAAGTPGCTAEACDFRDSLASLTAAGYAVVGVSPDPPADLRRFSDEHQLAFPLLADPDHAVHERYGAWGEKELEGRTVTGAVRSTFVLDADGRIEQALYAVPARGHVAELRRTLGLTSPGS